MLETIYCRKFKQPNVLSWMIIHVSISTFNDHVHWNIQEKQTLGTTHNQAVKWIESNASMTQWGKPLYQHVNPWMSFWKEHKWMWLRPNKRSLQLLTKNVTTHCSMNIAQGNHLWHVMIVVQGSFLNNTHRGATIALKCGAMPRLKSFSGSF